MKFSTPDNDNDQRNRGNCAAITKTEWWPNNCGQIDLNYKSPWINTAVLFSEMKIRPKDCITQ